MVAIPPDLTHDELMQMMMGGRPKNRSGRHPYRWPDTTRLRFTDKARRGTSKVYGQMWSLCGCPEEITIQELLDICEPRYRPPKPTRETWRRFRSNRRSYIRGEMLYGIAEGYLEPVPEKEIAKPDQAR